MTKAPAKPKPKKVRGHNLPAVRESTKFKKGVSGNPNGRPKIKHCLTSLMRAQMLEIVETDAKQRTWAELVCEATLRLAIKGNSTALKEVWDRMEGKITTELEGEVDIHLHFGDVYSKL